MGSFPDDPDLKPVAAAQAVLDQQAKAAAPVRADAPEQKTGPVIAPAEPDKWSRVFRLSQPLLVDGVLVNSLTLRRLTAADLMDVIAQDEREEKIRHNAKAAIAGVHPDVLDALDADDALEVADAIRPFLPRALQAEEPDTQAPAAPASPDAKG